MKKERLAEVRKGGDIRAAYTFALTDLGRERAREYLQFSAYIGAAPVTLRQYTDVAQEQTVRKMVGTRESVRRAFEGVILTPGLLERLGPAVNSGRSIFLYGPSGNGKTFIAERLAKVLSGNILIPHADLSGQPGCPRVRSGNPRTRRSRKTTRPVQTDNGRPGRAPPRRCHLAAG